MHAEGGLRPVPAAARGPAHWKGFPGLERFPWSGEVSLAFSCFEQDQPLDHVDFAALHQKLGQNPLQEKATALWVAANPVS